MLLNFTIIKLTICLVVGILLAHYLEPNFYYILYLTIGAIVLLGVYAKVLSYKINRSPVFGTLAFLCMIGIGMTAYKLQDETMRPYHYSKLTISEAYKNVVFQIEERLKPDAYNDKYIVTIKAINNEKTSGHLLINVKKDTTANHYNIDDILFASAQFKTIQKPLNPYQFDYSKYLELKQVYHQLYLEKHTVLKLSDRKFTIYGYADALRNRINEKLIKAGFKDDALSIMNALLLGQRQTIDKSVYTNYVNSGTIHILAVSGLHVGILLWILNFLFRPLLYLKQGNYIRPIVLVAILWSFAVIAGLSPSVTRAVTMFSIISIAMHLKRPTNIYNTLTISAFVILLVKPTFLFAVGFQMSYLAVFGIVSVQPIIYRLWKPKFLLTDKMWQIFTVTLAAQVGVVPISLFYFHQFPGLFFISNIVVIPFLGLILGLGMLVIALALIGILPSSLVTIYSFIIDSLNYFIAWIAQFEDFLFKDIPFTIFQVVLCYLIIVAMLQIYKFRNFKWTAIGLIAAIGFQATFYHGHFKTQDEALIIFNKSRYSLIGIKQNNLLTLYHNMDSTQLKNNQTIKNYKVGKSIDRIVTDSLQSVYQFRDKIILSVDSLSVYKDISFRPQFILLQNSPKLNLNRVIDSLKPEQIIADASNYKSYLAQWKATCQKRKIPFHQTNEKGAFILE